MKMNSWNNEAKVGAVTMAGLILLALMIFQLGHFSFQQRGYVVSAFFQQVNGLKNGANVRYAGVDVGTVNSLDIIPGGVAARLFLRENVHIPAQARFTIGADGLIGEKYISILPPPEVEQSASIAYLPAGVEVRGEEPLSIDQMMMSFDRVMNDMHKLVGDLNDIVGDEKVRIALKETAFNARDMTANLAALSGSLAQLVEGSQQDIAMAVVNLRAMSENLRSAAWRADMMLQQVDNNGQTIADLQASLHSIKIASASIERTTAAIENIATDPETGKNIKETLRNTRDASAKANQVLGKIAGIKVEAGAETLYNTTEHRFSTNADLRIGAATGNFALLGVNNIGEDSKWNLQFGHQGGAWGQRLGIINSKAGVGFDSDLSDRLRLSLDIYDPNDVRVKLRTQYRLNSNLYLVGEADSLNKINLRNTYFGVRRTF